MSTTALRPTHLATAPTSDIGVALRELAVATHHLVAALVATVSTRQQAASRALTASEAADQLRDYASTLPRSERGFADDLYAAADRHEFGQHR